MIKLTVNEDRDKGGVIFGDLSLQGEGYQLRNELTGILLAIYDNTRPDLVVDAISNFTKELAERQKKGD